MELREKYKEYEIVHQNFISLFKEKDFFQKFDNSVKSIDSNLISIGSAFKSNLESVVSILHLPIVLSSSRTKQYIFDKYLTQELILNAPTPNLGERQEEKNNQNKFSKEKEIDRAKEKFFKRLKTKEGAIEFWNITFRFLQDCLTSNNDLKISSQQLIKQGHVLLWTSFEVLARDFTIYYLNQNPDLFREFGLKSLPTEILDRYNFNVEDKLGHIYAEMHDWSNVSTIIKTFKIIQPKNNELLKRLGDTKLWKLNQRRHLIVHRSSIVDKKYVDSTDDKFKIGNELIVNPDEIIENLNFISELGIIILKIKV